jgi:hypothetical protein
MELLHPKTMQNRCQMTVLWHNHFNSFFLISNLAKALTRLNSVFAAFGGAHLPLCIAAMSVLRHPT